MTDVQDTRPSATDRTRRADPPAEGYRWTCPYCGRSWTDRLVADRSAACATAALRVHIMASDGDGHGLRGAFPEDLGLDIMTLDEHVVRVED